MSKPTTNALISRATPRPRRLHCWRIAGLLLAVIAGPLSAQMADEGRAASQADRQTEHRVEQTLDSQPALREVKADVAQGVATLSGQVATPPDRKAAADITADTHGVQKVENDIQLDPNLEVRFASALDEVQAKLVRLVASLPLLLVALLIVVLAIWFGGVLGRRLPILERISNRNPYMDNLLRGIVQGLVVLGGVLLALDLLGATSLVGAVLGSAGVVGLVLGFAFKDIAENYIAGVLLSIRRPFNPGDLVRIDVHEGRVVALNSRATQLLTVEGNRLLLPNSLVFNSVMLNYSQNPSRRFDFTTNIAAGQSWHEAMDIGIQTMRGIDGVLADPPPSALIQELGNDAATLRFMGWINQHQNDLAKTRSEAMRLVRRALRSAALTPPDGVQKLQLIRDPGAAATVKTPAAGSLREDAQHRDISVDRTLDKQLDHATSGEAGKDLLKPEGEAPATKPAH